MLFRCSLLLAASSLCFVQTSYGQQAADFNRDIRPILSDKCFHCHGPDEASREAGLRLDIEAVAHEAAFAPESPDDSEAWLRIISDDKDSVMPPPKSHKELSDLEKQLIKNWIQSGAKYEQHWSFRKVTRPAVPKVEEPRFASSAIDAFAYQAMRSKGLQPSGPASKRALIRRVTLDLIGLPPTAKEVDQFLADEASNAFEKVVDRLLASPHFGERMAVEWMDVARYGDTSVFHADGPRDMWLWRDWVVEAYNQNMPYDEFTIKQLAGDLLPNRTVKDHLASGFNRNNASSDEGGAIAEEYRVEYAVDRVKTTSMVWMGLSMECAQCHDHKYDPISQEDYYRFFAFFNRAADPGMQSRRGNQAPVVDVLDEQKMAKVPATQKQIAATKQQLADLKTSSKPAFTAWLAEEEPSALQAKAPTDMAAFFSFDAMKKSKVVNEQNPNDKVKQVGKVKFPEAKFGKAVKTTNNQYLSSTETGEEFAGDTEISYGCWVKGKQSGAPIARMNDGQRYVGFDLFLQKDGVAAHFIHDWPKNGVKVIAPAKLNKDKWYHLFVTYDGSKKAKGIKIYVDGKHVPSKPSHNTLTGSTLTDTPFTIGRRKNGSQYTGLVDDVRVYRRKLLASEVAAIAQADPLPALLAIAEDERTAEQNERLLQIFLERNVPQHNQLKQQLAGFEKEVTRLKTPLSSVMVMKDQDKPRMTYVLDRGQYDAPNKQKPVEPGVPSFLPDFKEGYQANRLGMAKWLTSPDHPLTSRVTVNRIWKTFFGTGLVESVEDFGRQGSWPSHPELLDWLAADFVASDWDNKRFIKMLVMSQTYQQSSKVTADQIEIDPSNRYLSRGPRFRLPGEFLRDQVLATSGLLNPKMGGPGVKPYQPPGLWNEVSLNKNLRFKRDDGEKLYRRSLYTYWKRSSPPPNMVIFDTPSREKCIVRRDKTNTPLQALVLMNDPQYVEAARVFAERIQKDGGASLVEKIEFAFSEALARKPTEAETKLIKEVFQREVLTFTQTPERAKKLLAVGEHPRDESLSVPEVAAWTIIANLIFNLDEFVTRG